MNAAVMRTASADIGRLLPTTAANVTDQEILEAYTAGTWHAGGKPWVRLNFVASVDGSATRDGRSGGLGTPADSRVFDLLRLLADVILIGAGTVRAEGYGAMMLPASAVRWRRANGKTDHPALAIVSGRLGLDAASPIFRAAPLRPIVYTTAVSADKGNALHAAADVIAVGDRMVDPRLLIADLRERGHGVVHCEGGPTLAGQLVACGEVDELCLTISPQIDAGPGGRVIANPIPAPQGVRLAALHHSDSTLLARYVRDRMPEAGPPPTDQAS
jgi:riboflavin biosynthesis pyrimidine reductase